MDVGRRLLVAGACLAAATVLVLIVTLEQVTPTSDSGDARTAPVALRPPEAAGVAQDVVLPEPAVLGMQSVDAAPTSPTSEDGEAPEPPSTLIRGTVRDGRGVPIEPFDVALSIDGTTSAPTRSDGQGRFALSLDRVPPGAAASAVLAFRACGFALLEQPVQLRGGQDCVIEAVLQPATDAPAGRVLDDRGQPLAGVEVRVRMRGTSVAVETARSDAEGRFKLRCARGEDVETMSFLHPEYLERRLDRAEVAADWHDVEVALQRGCDLAGTVLDAWGRPAAAVQVLAVAARPDAPQAPPCKRSAVTDADGAFRLTGMPPGQVALDFRRPTATPGAQPCLTDVVVAAEDRSECGTFTLPAGCDSM